MIKKRIGLILIMVIVLMSIGCSAATTKKDDEKNTPTTAVDSEHSSGREVKVDDPEVTIEMENGGIIKIALFPDVAPNTVNNFVSLVDSGYFDGLIFHRVIPGFMIQGGEGSIDYSIKGEFAQNGYENSLKHTRGVISMARTNDPNSASSQFFIMVDTAAHLDGGYAAFGMVTEGMDVVDEIVNTPTGPNDKPVEDQTIKKVTVDKKGIEYAEVIKE